MKFMDSRFVEKLVDEFPSLFRQMGAEDAQPEDFPVQCGDAWFPLIYVFCRTVHAMESDMAITRIEQRHAKIYIEGITWSPDGFLVDSLVQVLREYTERVCVNCGEHKPYEPIDNGWVIPFCETCFEVDLYERQKRNERCLEKLDQLDLSRATPSPDFLGEFETICDKTIKLSRAIFCIRRALSQLARDGLL